MHLVALNGYIIREGMFKALLFTINILCLSMWTMVCIDMEYRTLICTFGCIYVSVCVLIDTRVAMPLCARPRAHLYASPRR